MGDGLFGLRFFHLQALTHRFDHRRAAGQFAGNAQNVGLERRGLETQQHVISGNACAVFNQLDDLAAVATHLRSHLETAPGVEYAHRVDADFEAAFFYRHQVLFAGQLPLAQRRPSGDQRQGGGQADGDAHFSGQVHLIRSDSRAGA